MKNEKPEDTIWELIVTLKDYKYMIFIITFISLVLGIFYTSVWHKNIYKISTSIQIAQRNAKPIESIDMYIKRLHDIHIKDSDNTMPKISLIKILDEKKGVVQLVALADNHEDLIRFFNKTIDDIIQLDELIEQNITKTRRGYANYIQYNQSRLDIATENKKKSSSTLKRLREYNLDINSTEQITNENILPILKTINHYLQYSIYEKRDIRYKNVKQWSKRNLSKKRTFETRIYNNSLSKPIKITPSKNIIISASVVSGLLFSILFALFLSFLRQRN